jgi:hypothetical protein
MEKIIEYYPELEEKKVLSNSRMMMFSILLHEQKVAHENLSIHSPFYRHHNPISSRQHIKAKNPLSFYPKQIEHEHISHYKKNTHTHTYTKVNVR